jgi:hypothetical protein
MAKYFVRLLAVTIVTLVFTVLVIEPLSSPHRYGNTKREWTPQDSKAYAYDKLGLWRDKQMSCLSMLWGKESAWNPKAYNKIKVQGRNAGGIPQILGLDPNTHATKQIERGLDYIYYRYHTPCRAWQHFRKHGWY